MFSLTLKDFLLDHKDYIVGEIFRYISTLPRSTYYEFILNSNEGRRRIFTWAELLINSLGGKRGPFYDDQARIGYMRAIQNYKLDNVSEIYKSFQRVVWKLLKKELSNNKSISFKLLMEFQELNEIILQGYNIVAGSFYRTREEGISERVNELQQLYEFSHEIITTFDLGKSVQLILERVKATFEADEALMVLYQDDRIRGIYSFPNKKATQTVLPIVIKSFKEVAALFVDHEGHVYDNIDQCIKKKIICTPVYAHRHAYGAIALSSNTNGLKFTVKELNLLYQFLYIATLALENAFMFEEINQSQQELRLLTGKMVTIQEEERKRLASDIHDSLAQALTGIGYKIQYCKELVNKKPSLLSKQLDVLGKIIDETVFQSREMISRLRPDLVDTIGLLPALKHLFKNYTKETGIHITSDLSEKIVIAPDMAICLFRMIQEALTNVHKHACSKNIEIVLQEENDYACLSIVDDGKGFDMRLGAPWMRDSNKIGLLSMKERVTSFGGVFLINSSINSGCRIHAKLPLKGRANPNG